MPRGTRYRGIKQDPRAPWPEPWATSGGRFAKLTFAPGSEAELILGLSARLPMPRGRQLVTARWGHARYAPSSQVDDTVNLALRRGRRKRRKVRTHTGLAGRGRQQGNQQMKRSGKLVASLVAL